LFAANSKPTKICCYQATQIKATAIKTVLFAANSKPTKYVATKTTLKKINCHQNS
jgi:hypothetical protein